MKDKLLDAFAKKIKKLGIPTYSIGRISKADDTTRFFEVLVRRPERYKIPAIIKLIPKKYKGFPVKVF